MKVYVVLFLSMKMRGCKENGEKGKEGGEGGEGRRAEIRRCRKGGRGRGEGRGKNEERESWTLYGKIIWCHTWREERGGTSSFVAFSCRFWYIFAKKGWKERKIEGKEKKTDKIKVRRGNEYFFRLIFMSYFCLMRSKIKYNAKGFFIEIWFSCRKVESEKRTKK